MESPKRYLVERRGVSISSAQKWLCKSEIPEIHKLFTAAEALGFVANIYNIIQYMSYKIERRGAVSKVFPGLAPALSRFTAPPIIFLVLVVVLEPAPTMSKNRRVSTARSSLAIGFEFRRMTTPAFHARSSPALYPHRPASRPAAAEMLIDCG